MNLLIIIIAISLSMDAFSLALVYGTLNIKKSDIIILSVIVGIYHFFMPIIGMLFGKELLKVIKISPNIIIFLVFFLIGIEMIVDSIKNDNNVKIMNLFEMLMFGFAVSLDSFSVGIGLNTISKNFLLSSLIFSIFSFLFTNLGLILGKKISLRIGKFSTLIGGVVLIIIGFFYVI